MKCPRCDGPRVEKQSERYPFKSFPYPKFKTCRCKGCCGSGFCLACDCDGRP